MTITVDLNTLAAGPTFPQLSVGQLGAALGLPDEPYIIRVVDMVGTVIAALTNTDPTDRNQAQPGDIVETLNTFDTFAITFPKHAFEKTDVDLLGNATTPMEVQILLGGEVLAWGPAIAEQGGSSSESVTLQCAGVEWYFPKRAIDEEPVNIIDRGGFELGTTAAWRVSGLWHAGHPGGGTIGDGTTVTVETDNVFEGIYSARITATAAPTGLAMVSSPVNFTSGPRSVKLVLTFSACIETFISPAVFNAGVVFIAGPPNSDGAPQGGVNAKASAVWRIDNTTPRDIELRQALEIRIPPNKTWAFQVVVFAPNGSTVYDNFFIAAHKKLDTATLSGGPVVDCSRIVRMIADHTFSDLHHHGKSDLHIGLDTPDCGVKQQRVYEFTDHIPVDQAIGEFVGRDDCFDTSMDYTPTTRTWRLHPVSGGGLGTDYGTDVVLTYGTAPVASYATSLDGGSTATQIAELGDGSGQTREEAWDTDASRIGGTTLQASIAAPAGAPFNSLEPLARSAVALRGNAAEVLEVTITREPGGYGPDPLVILADLLKLGDRVTIAITDGWHTYGGLWRIVRRTRHCRARTMQYTLNRVAA